MEKSGRGQLKTLRNFRVAEEHFWTTTVLWRFCLIVSALLVQLISSSAAIPEIKHIVVIGCDGFGSVAFTPDNAPVLHRLMQGGAWTLHARGVLPTVSSPNWASMIMGAGPAQHGITSNDWQTNKFEISPIAVGSGGIFPTIFGVIREQRPKAMVACVHDWPDFSRLVEPKATDLKENVVGSAATADRAIEVLKTRKPDFLFIHFDDVDHAGHTQGWKSSEYFAAVEVLDAIIGKVIKAIDETNIRASTLIIMTADHGGKGKGHGNATMEELEIPLILNGPGILPSHEIKAPVNTYDLAPTIAWAWGLRTPDCWIGKPVMEAFKTKR